MQPHIIVLDSTESTNTVLRDMAARQAVAGNTVVAANEQTAGRGQRGNSWEAEPGKNLTFSMLLRPEKLKASEQFVLSEAVALGVAEAIEAWLPENAPHPTVKWPNDIYIGDRKISGILIENTLAGAYIEHSIAGIGININQKTFTSDAPNPVSLIHYTGIEEETGRLLRDVCDRIAYKCETIGDLKADIHRQFLSRLWRAKGFHPYRRSGGDMFLAEIADIAPDGMLTLRTGDGKEYTFAFKEVEAVL